MSHLNMWVLTSNDCSQHLFHELYRSSTICVGGHPHRLFCITTIACSPFFVNRAVSKWAIPITYGCQLWTIQLFVTHIHAEHSKTFHSLSLCMLVLKNLCPLCLSSAMVPSFGETRGGHQEEQLFAQIRTQLDQKLKANGMDSNVYISLSIFFDFLNVGFLVSLIYLINLYIKDRVPNSNSIEFKQQSIQTFDSICKI